MSHALWSPLVLATLVLTPLPDALAQAMAADAALVEALRQSAPRTEDPRLFTDWKMQAAAIGRWSRRCLGVAVPPGEFAANPVQVRETVACVMGPVLAEQLRRADGDEALAVRRAGAWWMTGDPEREQAPELAPYLDRLLSNYWALTQQN
jgi:hypothetical protein